MPVLEALSQEIGLPTSMPRCYVEVGGACPMRDAFFFTPQSEAKNCSGCSAFVAAGVDAGHPSQCVRSPTSHPASACLASPLGVSNLPREQGCPPALRLAATVVPTVPRPKNGLSKLERDVGTAGQHQYIGQKSRAVVIGLWFSVVGSKGGALLGAFALEGISSSFMRGRLSLFF